MTSRALDLIADSLDAAADGAAFEEHFGKNAAAFVVQLPPLFQMLRRASFDLDLPLASRHMAAAAALYVIEPGDFLGDEAQSRKGLIDDVWVAYSALARIVDEVGEPALEQHWRGGAELAFVVGLAGNISSLEPKVPSHVLDRVGRFLSGK